MSRIPGLRRFMRIDRTTAGVERGVDDELRFHFDMTVSELMANGLTPDDARREAERRFGDVAGTRANLERIDRERAGREQRAEWWSAFAQDFRYALRGLRHKPGFALAVVLTLGLGIGANATMFGIVDRLLFRPPAYLIAPARVHRIFFERTIDGKARASSNTQYRRYLDIARTTTSFDAVGTYFEMKLAVGVGSDARELPIGTASASLWTFFDARPVIGRFFTAEEDQAPAGAKVAVLSYAYWHSQYAGRSTVLGGKINIGPSVFTIIGVAPKGFAAFSVKTPSAFVPITAAANDAFGGIVPGGLAYHTGYNLSWTEVFARRRPNLTIEQATADLTAAYRSSYAAQIAERPSTVPLAVAKPHVIAAPVQSDRGPRPGESSKVAIWLVGVATIVLLIACANVANLLLGRALRRRREIAVRIALGVSRARLLTQLLTESLLLAALGGVAGVLASQWGGGVIRATLLPNVEWGNAIADRRLLLFAAAAASVAGVLTGLAPALQARRVDVASSLKSGAREGTMQRTRLRTILLVVQAALSVVLLVGAGLFVRSLRNVQSVDLGYDPEHLLWVSPELRGTTIDSVEQIALRERLAARARQIPGVENATRAVTVPFWISQSRDISVPGIDSVNRLGEFTVQYGSPEYFTTMGTRIVRGRGITTEDRLGAPLAIVVSQSMARALWPGQDAIGKCVKAGADTVPCSTVVGVAADIKSASLNDDPALRYYRAIAQVGRDRGGVFVRTRGNATEQSDAIRRELQRVMPGAAYVNVFTMSSVIAPVMQSWKLGATMFAVFGALALLLAAIGLYSVIAYNVTQRTHEMGVRVALGAQRGDLLRLVVGGGVRVAVAGVVLGAAAALAGGRWIAPLLFNVSPRDVSVFASVIVTLLVVAVVASWWPAVRATRVDPNTALRSD